MTKSLSTRSELHEAIFGRSRCDHCQKPIAWYDNIPLLSWVVLQARCRHCRKSISHYHPLLEASSGLYLVAAYLAYGLSIQLVVAGVFGLIMLLIFAYDLKHQIIPNVVVVPALVLALVLLVCQYGIAAERGISDLGLWSTNPNSYLAGGLALGGFFLGLSILSKGGWIGGGDIKLGLLIGLLLGWPYTLVAVVLAYLIGTVYAVILLATRKAKMKTFLPFGPMLVMGFFITAFYGDQIIKWYQGWFL